MSSRLSSEPEVKTPRVITSRSIWRTRPPRARGALTGAPTLPPCARANRERRASCAARPSEPLAVCAPRRRVVVGLDLRSAVKNLRVAFGDFLMQRDELRLHFEPRDRLVLEM